MMVDKRRRRGDDTTRASGYLYMARAKNGGMQIEDKPDRVRA